MTIGWWDFSWHNNKTTHSPSQKRVVSQLVGRGHRVALIGLPRKPIGFEDAYAVGLRENLGLETRWFDIVRGVCREVLGEGGTVWDAMVVLEGKATDDPSSFIDPLKRYDKIVQRVGPSGFPEAKLHYASVLMRIMMAERPVALYDDDGGWAKQCLDLAYQGYNDGMYPVTLWASYLTPIPGFKNQEFMFGPLGVCRVPNDGPWEFDLGYVGNHWAANGPNAPHFERLLCNIGTTLGVAGDWPIDKLPDIEACWMPPIPATEVRDFYHKRCLATIFMCHGVQKRPHATPRIVEAMEAGVPLLWDYRCEDLQDVVYLHPALRVDDADDVVHKLTALKESPKWRRELVEFTQQKYRTMPASGIEDWERALEELK